MERVSGDNREVVRMDEDVEEGPVLTPEDQAAVNILRYDKCAKIAFLGAGSAGINLNLTDKARQELLSELRPTIEALGFR